MPVPTSFPSYTDPGTWGGGGRGRDREEGCVVGGWVGLEYGLACLPGQPHCLGGGEMEIPLGPQPSSASHTSCHLYLPHTSHYRHLYIHLLYYTFC